MGKRRRVVPPANEDVIAKITRELEASQRDLRVHFTRIAQLQVELDELRAALNKSTPITPQV